MNYTQEQKCYIWLASLRGLGSAAARSMIAHLGGAQAVRQRAEKNLDTLEELSPAARAAMRKTLAPDYLNRLADALSKREIVAVTPAHQEYSPLLGQIADPPLTLYARGDLSLLRSPGLVAMVGSRSATRYGQKVTRQLARDLALQGVTVVSGMARGIDTCAHEGALDAGGKTIAVLGCGVDVVYPPENRELYDRIVAEGLVISEFLPGAPPLKEHFPERNRIISGLCQGVVVLEAGEKSGARITANTALEQGREVMAVPGNIDMQLSYTPNQLIREGCPLITSARDVMEALGWIQAREVEPHGESTEDRAEEKAPAKESLSEFKAEPLITPLPEDAPPPKVTPGKPTEDEARVLGMLAMGPASFDEIFEALEISPARLGATLTIMVAKGMIRNLPGKVYEIND